MDHEVGLMDEHVVVQTRNLIVLPNWEAIAIEKRFFPTQGTLNRAEYEWPMHMRGILVMR